MYDVIIIGSGPSGYSAAIYTSRAFLKTLLISGQEIGGQLTTTTQVENYPGFPKGILGPQLVEDMKSQAQKFGTEVIMDTIKNINIQDKPVNKFQIYRVRGQEKEYQAKAVIIATGASARYLGLPSEDKFRGKGVSACATCDGFFFRGKEVVVLGGGDTAMEEANFLTTFATKVTVIHRRDKFRASPIMLARIKKNPKISLLTNKIVEEIVGDKTVSGIRIKDVITGESETYKTQGVFLAIGHIPNTTFVKDFIELDEKGYVRLKFQTLIPDGQIPNPDTGRVNSKEQIVKHENQTEIFNPRLLAQTETSQEGVFAAGDCVDPRYRQAAVAAGMGVMAAMDVQKWLEEKY